MNKLKNSTEAVFFSDRLRLGFAAAILAVAGGCGALGPKINDPSDRICYERVTSLRRSMTDFWRYTRKYPKCSPKREQLAQAWWDDVVERAKDLGSDCHDSLLNNDDMVGYVREHASEINRVRAAYNRIIGERESRECGWW